ncbi:MAG: hypothetical protein Q8K46_06300 [Deltaproteobacteria bacterium]|nr:hypothetical protein [Deltaproteobacteria bacterium]
MVSLVSMESDKEQDLVWHRRYEIFTGLYKGREDVIAEQRHGEYFPVEGEGLTFERFLDHVQLKKTYAVYNKDQAEMVNFGLFDVDVFPRDKGWEPILAELGGKKRDTLRIMRTLEEMGLERRNLLVEFPTVGYHLLIFFDKPVSAKALKKVMRFVLQRSGLEQIPFYPKKVDAPWGDRVQLPLRINLNTSKRSNFVSDLESFDPEHYSDQPNFDLLDEVAPINSAWVSSVLAKYDLQ